MKKVAIILGLLGAGLLTWYLAHNRKRPHLEELAPETQPVIPKP